MRGYMSQNLMAIMPKLSDDERKELCWCLAVYRDVVKDRKDYKMIICLLPLYGREKAIKIMQIACNQLIPSSCITVRKTILKKLQGLDAS